MAACARRGAMPHHHVPESKEAPPVVHRLRLELNRTVRRRVTEAVDAVCVAFEEDLTHLVAPSVVDNFESFYECCSRLAQFIATNMDTSPGFLQQMDRLIIACHSGASGTAVQSVMTNDLHIRRRDPGANGDKHEDVESRQPVISPGKIAKARNKRSVRDESSDNELEVADTASRRWRTRKRLSTTNYASTRTRSKRVKMLPVLDLRRRLEESDEEKRISEDAHKKKGSGRASKRDERAANLSKLRVKRTRRTGKYCGEPQRSRSAGSTERGEAVEADHGCRIRWNLRSLSKDASALSGHQEINGDEESGAQHCEEKRSQPNEGLASNQDSDVGGAEHDTDMTDEAGVTADTAHVGAVMSITASESDQACLSPEIEQHFQVKDSGNDVEMAITSNEQSEAESDEAINANKCYSSGLERASVFVTRKAVKFVPDEKTESTFSGKSSRDGVSTVLSDSERVDKLPYPGKKDVAKERPLQCEVFAESSDHESPSTDPDELKLPYPVASEEPSTTAADPQNQREDQEGFVESEQQNATSESEHEPSVPGLCDAGMRPPHQVIHFKACLRKAIQFVDAVLCKPPPGKTCARNCQKIRSRQCGEGRACRDPLCRNWHQAEAHTERCKNPLCEFRNRIMLREIMHQIANQDTQTRLLTLQWENKYVESTLATTNSSSKQYTEMELSRLRDEAEQLERRVSDAKEESESLKNTRRVLLANLSAIGIKPQDDEADSFPDYNSHYKSYGRSR